MDFVLVSCTVHHMSRLQTTDPIPLPHNHTQELWSGNPSNYFYNYAKCFQAHYQNLTDISRDIHFDFRNYSK